MLSLLSTAMDATIIKPLIEVGIGRDLITGDDLSAQEEAMKMFGAALSISGAGESLTEVVSVFGEDTFWQVAKTEALKAGLGNVAANGTLYVGEKAHFPVPVTMLLAMTAGFAVHRIVSASGQEVLQMVNGEGEVLAEKAVTTDAVQEVAARETVGESSYAKSNEKLFKTQSLLEEHFEKHGKEIADVLGESNYTIDKYLSDANNVINNGTYVPELNGYVKFMSGKKFGVVGISSTTGEITTFHIKNISELIKKAPSLGFER